MLDIQVIDDPATATVALEPIRSRLLSEMAAPASAATLAARVGLGRQKVNYHLRALEKWGMDYASLAAETLTLCFKPCPQKHWLTSTTSPFRRTAVRLLPIRASATA